MWSSLGREQPAMDTERKGLADASSRTPLARRFHELVGEPAFKHPRVSPRAHR